MGNNILNACKNTSNTTNTSAPVGAVINGGIDGEQGENSRERRKHERKKTKKSSDTSAVHAAETLMLVAPQNIKEQQLVKSADIEQSTDNLVGKHIINGSQSKVIGVVDKKNRERKTSNINNKNNEMLISKRQNDAVSNSSQEKNNKIIDDSSSQIINLKNNNDKYFTKEDLLYYENMLKNEKKQPPPKDKNIRWQQGEVLGTGSFGQVILGMNIDTGEFMAVKQVHIGGYNQQDRKEKVQQIQSEIEALQNFSDKNIVRYIGIKKSDTSINIFLEYVPGGSISSLLYRYNKFNETLIRKFTNQILKGLEYLHAHDVIHRDIKGANVLVDKDGNCKLADFGSAKKIVEEKGHNDSIRGTPYWMAPETIKQVGSGRFADIWSIGCTVIEMATAKPPWADKNPIQAMFYIANAVEPPPIPDGLSPECKDFISKCLRIIPSQRYNVRQLLHHPFITRKKTVTNMNHSVRQLVQITEECTVDYQTTYSPDKRKDFLYRGDSRGNTFFHEDMNTFTEKTKAFSVKTKTQQSSKSHKSLHRKGSYNDRSADSLVELQRQKSSQSNHHRQLNTQSKHIQSRSSLVQQQHNDSVDSKLGAQSQAASSQLQLYQLSEGRSILSQDKSHSSPTHQQQQQQHGHHNHHHNHHQQNQQRQYNHNQSIQTQNEGERSLSESSSNHQQSHSKYDDEYDDSSSNSHSIGSSSSLSNSCSSNSSNNSNNNINNSNNKEGKWRQSEKGSVVSYKSHSSQRIISASQQQQQFRRNQSNQSNSNIHSPSSGTPLANETNQKKRKSLFLLEQNQQREKDKNKERESSDQDQEKQGGRIGRQLLQDDNNNILINDKDQDNNEEDDGFSEGQQVLQQQVHPSAEYVHSLYHLPSQLLQQPMLNQNNNSSGSPTYSEGYHHNNNNNYHRPQSNSNSHRQQQAIAATRAGAVEDYDDNDDLCDGFKREKFQGLKYSRPFSPKRLITQHSVGSSVDHGNQNNTPSESVEHKHHKLHHQHTSHHHFTHNEDDVTNNKRLDNDEDSTQANS